MIKPKFIKPKISVLMPVHNSQKYLSTSIESILSQSFKDYEFIIINDGSTDDSLKIIEKYKYNDERIVLIKNKFNLGTTKSLNRGLLIAGGKYMVRMDADDWSYPDRLKTQYEYMEKHSEIGVSGGAIDVCDEDLNIIYTRKYALTDKEVRKKIFLYSPFAHPATIWNTEKIKKLGGYNERLPLSQDCELYFKVGQFVKFGNISGTLIKLRMHNSSSSISKDFIQEQYAIYARLKAIMEFGYVPRLKDKLFILCRIIAMFTIPKKIKFIIFNLLRRNG